MILISRAVLVILGFCRTASDIGHRASVQVVSGRDDDDSSTSGTERTEQTLTMTLAAEGSAATSGALMIDGGLAESGAEDVTAKYRPEGELDFSHALRCLQIGVAHHRVRLR